jgi:hypothetical protein
MVSRQLITPPPVPVPTKLYPHENVAFRRPKKEQVERGGKLLKVL